MGLPLDRPRGTRGNYEITIRDLGRERTFHGTASGEVVSFQRATNGGQTGMKWLAGQAHCPAVKPGEGYCRG